MRAGERIAFWSGGRIHVGTVTVTDFLGFAVMVSCPTIDSETFLVRSEDIITEEETEDDG